MTKPFALALALLMHSTVLGWAVSVVPGTTFRSDFDLRGVPVLGGPPPYGFNEYAVDLQFESGGAWIVGQKIYLEVRSATDALLGGITIAQPFPFDIDNISGIDIRIATLNQSSDLVGYLLLTSIDASFDVLTSSGYFDHDNYAQTNQRIRTGFVAAPFNPPNPNFPTWGDGSGGVSEVPVPAALPLFATVLGVMGFLAWRRKRPDQSSVISNSSKSAMC